MSEKSADTLTAVEAARKLGVSEAAIRKRIKSGSLSATKDGAAWSIPYEEIARLLSEPNSVHMNAQTELNSEQGNAQNRSNNGHQDSKVRYTAKEAAQLAGVSYSTIRRHITEGKLTAKRNGRCLWVNADDMVGLYPNFNMSATNGEDSAYNTAHNSNQTPPNSVHTVSKGVQNIAESAELCAQLGAVSQERDALRQENEYRLQDIEHLRNQVGRLTDELTESRQRSDTIIMKLTQQLESAHLQLEDFRQRRTVWQRIKAVFVAE